MYLFSVLKFWIKINNLAAFVQRIIFFALYLIIPGQLHRSVIMKSSARLELQDLLMRFLIELNEEIDFTLAFRKDLHNFIKYLKAQRIKTEVLLQRKIQELKFNDIYSALKQVIKEVGLIEKSYRKFQLDLVLVDEYRNLVDAIENILVIAVVFQDKSLLKLLGQKAGRLSAIKDNYQWVFNQKFQTPIESAIVILHNFVMSNHIDDDWFSRHIDEKLNIPTYASAAIKKYKNAELARVHLKIIKKQYLDKAIKLGFSSSYVYFFSNVCLILFWLDGWLCEYGRNHPQSFLTNLFLNNWTPEREKAYMCGIL